MTTGEKIRTKRKQLGMTVDELAAKLGKNRATIYRYENDAIEMPASLLKPLSEALDTEPADLMDWDELIRDEVERQEKVNEILPLIGVGVSIEGESQKYILLKLPTQGGALEENLRELLLLLCQVNIQGQDSKMRTLRVLGELAMSLDSKSRDHLISYAEYLDSQCQKRRGVVAQHPYQLE